MFEQLTERARRVILFSREEAERLMQGYIETEHILLGLLRERSGIAAEIFASHRIHLGNLVKELRGVSSADSGDILFKGNIPFGLLTKRALEYALEEARLFDQKYVNTEHLLLGLMRERRGKAFPILAKLGFDYAALKEEIRLHMKGGNTTKSSSTSATPTLDEFGIDLTRAAHEGRLDPIIGREAEVGRLIQILSRRMKNNAILLGEPGVGKTAIVEGLAQQMISENAPNALRHKRLISIELGGLVAGTKYRGQFEERMKTLLKEIETVKNIVIFIDEIHTIVGAGAAEGSIDAANILKPALARGVFQCIGATTPAEYRKNIERDGALERRFQTIAVEQPTADDTSKILKGIRKNYEDFHKVWIPDEVINETISLTERYISYKYQPDKSIDVIDEACAKVKLAHQVVPLDLSELQEQIRNLKEGNATGGRAPRGIFSEDEFNRYNAELERLGDMYQTKVALWTEELESNWPFLTVDDVAEVISGIAKVPVRRLKQDERTRLLTLESELNRYVIGQNEALERVSKAMRRSFAGVSSASRPMGSFIFLGPTGVGKTEVAKRLAQSVFGNQDALIRIDMSEFGEKFNVSRLIGAPPGYVGYDEGGKLTEQVRQKPYSVVLFDEVEKAHPDVLNILLQILDDGFVTDQLGHRVNFRNTILILTSNLGMKDAATDKTMGFATYNGAIDKAKFQSAADKALKRHFPPEFLNRVDSVIHFNPLGIEELKSILDIQIEELNARLRKQDKQITLSDEAKTHILSDNYNYEYGARPLRRILQTEIEDLLSEKLLTGSFAKRKRLKVKVKSGKIAIV
ncbi:MAG: ATP-dependent Clp protease ATP-binding subunit [Deferribacteraceae bacterium]|jgi:ATP-dependent Clp protease ATP-binding subunit ClpC|nr:ATP-dependent Clp protease ATP-binding subunit [Deferribacteraceae bacterium]